MTNFKPGDTVRLNSGGPLMTVDSVDDENGTVDCEWFSDKKELMARTFSAHSLGHDDGSIRISVL